MRYGFTMLWLLTMACNGTDTPPATDTDTTDTTDAAVPAAPTWHADVAPIITASCAGCHSEGAIGGFSLTTMAEVEAWSQAVYVAVESGTMPPWLAADDCSTYQQDFSLSSAEVQTVLDWIDGGMPEGDPDAALPIETWRPAALDRVDLTLEMPISYTPKQAPDDYRCFVMEWPYEETVWVTGYEVVPGNDTVVHHVIPFLISPENAEEYRQLDAADSEEGYTCYGSPGGSITTLTTSRWLGAWAPGGGASTTPAGTGLEVKPGSLVVMQVHYFIEAEPSADLSTLNLRIESEEQQWADVQPWTNPIWLAGVGMDIPANTEGVTHSFSYTTESRFNINSAMLHMHNLGVSGRLSVLHTDGSETCLLDIPQWDFNWQRDYWLTEPYTIEPGETLSLTCTWDNPTDADIAWGDGTGDEMCLGITTISSTP